MNRAERFHRPGTLTEHLRVTGLNGAQASNKRGPGRRTAAGVACRTARERARSGQVSSASWTYPGMSSTNSVMMAASARWSVSLAVDFATPTRSARSVSEQVRGVS